MSDRELYLKAYTFQTPERIPVSFSINHASWVEHREGLENLALKHKLLFPGFEKGGYDWNKEVHPWVKAGTPYTDPWGCVWATTEDGITGTVTKHPLGDWEKLKDFSPPDPERTHGMSYEDWDSLALKILQKREKDAFVQGGLHHGFLFLRLTYLRGFENIIFDMADDHSNLHILLDMIESFNRIIVKKYIELGMDMIGFPEDLGAQNGPLLSPDMFKKYIKPVHKRLMEPVRRNNILVHMHSDGHILDLMDDLIECGVNVINPQDLVNGIDELAKEVKGRVAINLDVDRQKITRFGTPADIDDLIHEEADKLGSKQGGLSLVFGLYPGTPLENINAVMDAMEKYTFYYS